MVTMKDVAKHAGVSVSTVSRVLNGRNWVKQEVRDRVQQAIDSLNYRPNFVAQSLKGGETKQIGVLVWDITNPYYADVAIGIEETAYQAGYSVILANCLSYAARDELRLLEFFLHRRVDGLIVAVALSPEGIQSLKRLAARGVPIAVCRELGWAYTGEQDYAVELGINAVDIDSGDGVKKAVDYLLSLGHERIGYLFGPSSLGAGEPRMHAYRDTLEARGIGFDPTLVVDALGYRQASGARGMQELLARRAGVTAVLAFNDLIACGALTVCYEQGLRVPDDISIVGFDNIEQSAYSVPPLTTVNVPKADQGQELVSSILHSISGKPARVRILKPNLVVRASTSFRQ